MSQKCRQESDAELEGLHDKVGELEARIVQADKELEENLALSTKLEKERDAVSA